MPVLWFHIPLENAYSGILTTFRNKVFFLSEPCGRYQINCVTYMLIRVQSHLGSLYECKMESNVSYFHFYFILPFYETMSQNVALGGLGIPM